MECSDFLIIIGDRIRSIRKSQKLSQEKLAEKANLHPLYILKVEKGQVKSSICTYLSIATALGMPLSQLVELPGDGAAWDANLYEIMQAANRLNEDKRRIVAETVKGVMTGMTKP